MGGVSYFGPTWGDAGVVAKAAESGMAEGVHDGAGRPPGAPRVEGDGSRGGAAQVRIGPVVARA